MKIVRITSKENPLLKKARSAGKGDGLALVEGPKLIDEALGDGFRLSDVMVAEPSVARYEELLERCLRAGARIASVTSAMLGSVADAVTSQGIVALTSPRFVMLEKLRTGGHEMFAVCDAIQDPGNLGAIVRSAFAFGAAAAILLPGCANPFGAKAIRGSAGACFKLPIVRSGYNEVLKFFQERRIVPYALDAASRTDLDAAAFAGSCAIIVGNEGSGINPILMAVVRDHLRIPVESRMESLNTAVSAAVVLYEMARRRRGRA